MQRNNLKKEGVVEKTVAYNNMRSSQVRVRFPLDRLVRESLRGEYVIVVCRYASRSQNAKYYVADQELNRFEGRWAQQYGLPIGSERDPDSRPRIGDVRVGDWIFLSRSRKPG